MFNLQQYKAILATTAKPARRQDEAQLQQTCVQWWRSHRILKPHQLVMIPNEGQRSAAMHAKMLSMGLVPGAPDMFCVRPDGKIAYFEFKAPKGKPSEDQLNFAGWCKDLKLPYYLIRSFAEFEAAAAELYGPYYKAARIRA